MIETRQLILQIIVFIIALWLGLYLIGRNWRDERLRLAGGGLVAYAFALGLDALLPLTLATVWEDRLTIIQRPFLIIPALLWAWLLVLLLREDTQLGWRSRLQQHKRPFAFILAATIFFGLGLSLLILPFDWIPRSWALLGIGIDLILLGASVAVLDAFDEGEALLPHFLRSLTYSFLVILIFGGQVALVIVLETDISLTMLLLLLTILTAAIATQTLSGPFQALLDQILLFKLPQAQEAQATFRAAAEASTRLDHKRDPEQIEMGEFVRLTRRALSHMGNLPKLASNPLTQLPIIETRLTRNGRADHTLERAAQLKTLLTESISRLKPSGDTHFGTTDAWRHFNAVYFPYVRGLRPYSRRGTFENLSETDQQAVSWFQQEVPQRTLYNWQNAAAQLIARDLRERAF